jgi:predicted nucleic acid-binding protein
MAEELYLLDTNILIRWLRREVADHSMVSAAIEQLARQNAVLCFTSQNLGELWNVLTRPAERRLLVAHGVCGAQVHDTRLVAAMLVHGVPRILTLNPLDFTRFDDIEAIHPLQLA